MLRHSSLRRFRECSEKSLGFFDLRKFRSRRKTFERGGEDVVRFEGAVEPGIIVAAKVIGHDGRSLIATA